MAFKLRHLESACRAQALLEFQSCVLIRAIKNDLQDSMLQAAEGSLKKSSQQMITAFWTIKAARLEVLSFFLRSLVFLRPRAMKPGKLRAAFSIVEIILAIGVMGVTTSATIAGLLKMNNNAALSRVRTGASTVAQNQIDYLLSIQPYNPQRDQIPPELATGTLATGSASNPTIPIYIDPATNVTMVKGYMTTDVTDLNQTVNGINTNLRRINVNVYYIFRGKTYVTTMSTLRSSDI